MNDILNSGFGLRNPAPSRTALCSFGSPRRGVRPALLLLLLTGLLPSCREHTRPDSGSTASGVETEVTAAAAWRASLALADEELFEVGDEHSSSFVRGYLLQGELRSPEPMMVPPDMDLELTPFLIAGDPTGKNRGTESEARAEIQLYRIDESGETYLGAFPPHPFDSVQQMLDGISRPVRIDLQSLGGQRVAFRWVVAPAETQAVIANLRLVPKEAENQSPHVLFVCSDTHRADYALGETGRRLMPRLHEVMREGVVYENAYSSASWTLPSIASTLTGLSPRFHRTGLRVEGGEIQKGEIPDVPAGHFYLPWSGVYSLLTGYPESLTTLTEALRREGYTTALVVANTLYSLSGLSRDGQDVVVDTGLVRGTEVNRSAFELMKLAAKGRPLFLLVHYMDVHHFRPWYFDKAHPDRKMAEDKEEAIRAYESAVRETDQNIGDLLAGWSQQVGFDNSLVVFYSDHGEHLLEPPGLLGHGNTMGEELLRVPLMVRYPKDRGPSWGVLEEKPVSLLDLYPTVLELAGAVVPSPPDGRGASLLHLATVTADRLFFADYQLYQDELSSVRRGEHKLTVNLTRGESFIELTQRIGAAAKGGGTDGEKVIQAQLEAAFRRHVRTAEKLADGLVSEAVIDQEKALKGLKALGYLQ